MVYNQSPGLPPIKRNKLFEIRTLLDIGGVTLLTLKKRLHSCQITHFAIIAECFAEISGAK
jgi:hypothetical protein